MTKQHEIRVEDELKAAYIEGLTTLPVVKEPDTRAMYAALFKAFGDETRLKLISFLTTAPACLCEMVDALGIANSTITHHLKLLERGGVVRKEKIGKFTVYQLTDIELVAQLLQLLKERKGDE
ncbi:MAG: ArsR/SmtB family transcription factor [Bacillota bacterium]